MAIVAGIPDCWQAAFPQAGIVADTAALNFPDGDYDTVLHGMALHWASDPVGQLVQCRLALRPAGLFMSASFGSLTLVELREAITQAEIKVTGGLSPRVAPMGEVTDLGNLLSRAGFEDQVSDAVTLRVSYDTAFDLMHDLRAMGETNALEARRRTFTPGRMFEEMARIYDTEFSTDDGRIRATFQIVFLTARAPGRGRPARRSGTPLRFRQGFRGRQGFRPGKALPPS